MCENIEKSQIAIPRMGQGEQLLGEYELEITGVSKGRGSLLIHTTQGICMLKPFTGSAQKQSNWRMCCKNYMRGTQERSSLLRRRKAHIWSGKNMDRRTY